MLETRKLWRPEDDDPRVHVRYAVIESRYVRKVAPLLKGSSYSIVTSTDSRTLVRGTDRQMSLDDVLARAWAYGVGAHEVPDTIGW